MTAFTLGGSRLLVWALVGITLFWGLFIYYDFTSRSSITPPRRPLRELISPDEHGKSHPPRPSISDPTKLTLRVAYLCSPNLAILPLLGYGGTESSCEAELDGLNALHKDDCLDFFAVVPTRKQPVPSYPFPIVEVGKPGMGGSEFVDLFVNEMNKWDKDKWPHLIWCQEEYCPDQFRKRGIDMPVVSTIHYGDGYSAKDLGPSVLYRFPSHYVFEKSQQSKPWIKDRGFVEWQAFKEDEFELSEQQGDYFLWVGGCYWDGQKGLPLFQQLAKQNPQYKFVVYCSGEPPVARRLEQFQKEVKNFEFRGELMRGEPHREAFKKAKAFFFWTHMAGETFGRVIIESLSKGTPVLGSTHAANPELITPGTGITTENVDDIVAAFNRTFDRRVAYERAQYFRSKNIVQGLLQKTRKWFTQLEHFHTFTEPSCLRRAVEGGP